MSRHLGSFHLRGEKITADQIIAADNSLRTEQKRWASVERARNPIGHQALLADLVLLLARGKKQAHYGGKPWLRRPHSSALRLLGSGGGEGRGGAGAMPPRFPWKESKQASGGLRMPGHKALIDRRH